MQGSKNRQVLTSHGVNQGIVLPMIYLLLLVVPSFMGTELHQTEMVIPLVDRVVRVLRLHNAGIPGVVVSLARHAVFLFALATRCR
jgi:hypothetical protein